VKNKIHDGNPNARYSAPTINASTVENWVRNIPATDGASNHPERDCLSDGPDRDPMGITFK